MIEVRSVGDMWKKVIMVSLVRGLWMLFWLQFASDNYYGGMWNFELGEKVWDNKNEVVGDEKEYDGEEQSIRGKH